MRIHGLLFLVLFVVYGVLIHVAALVPSDAPGPETPAFTAKKLSKIDDAAVYIRALNDRSQEERGPLLDSLFGPLKSVIEKLMRFIRSFGSRRPQNQPVKPVKPTEDHTPMGRMTKWLHSETGPEDALKELASKNDGIFEWFVFLANYQAKHQTKFSMDDAAKLLKYPAVKDEATIAETFTRMMRRPELKHFAEEVPQRRFQNMLVDNERLVLEQFARIFHPPGRRKIAELPEDDPVRRAYKAFTLEFAEVRGPFKRMKLESLYSQDKGTEAARFLAKIEKDFLKALPRRPVSKWKSLVQSAASH